MIRTIALCFAGLTLGCIPALADGHTMAGDNETLVMEGFAPNSQNGFTIRQTRIAYSPDSLNAPEAQATMHRRIEAAAHAVCRYNGPIINRTVRKKISDCETKAEHEALAKLHLPEPAHP